MTEPGPHRVRPEGGRWSDRELEQVSKVVFGRAEEAQPPPAVTEVKMEDWQSAVSSTFKHLRDNRVNVAAGAFAYRWFLSLFPTIIALLAAASLVGVPHSVTVKLIKGVTTALPSGASGVFAGAISAATSRQQGSLAAVAVASLVALWSAMSGMVVLEEGLDMAYDVRHDRSFLAKRFLAVPLLVGAVLLGGGASALVVFGPQIGREIGSALPFGETAFRAGWTVLRWLVALLLINLLLSFVYWLAPNMHTAWRWLSPGAVAGTVVWAFISLGFSFYTSSFGSYGKTYGAFAGVAILIFWLFLTGMAVLLGGELNAAFQRQRLQIGQRSEPPTEAA
jgi:membrane protein